EVVIREYITDVDDRLEIYHTMPLRTEFRVFYDFDEKKTFGIANYWHPHLMEEKGALDAIDAQVYKIEKQKIMKEYQEDKNRGAAEVDFLLKGCDSLHGKWSMDIMKNGDSYYIIDMARMEYSELIDQMEEIKEDFQ